MISGCVVPRDRGWLKPDALHAGWDEQYATFIAGVQHTVTLKHERFGGFVVLYQHEGMTTRIEYGVSLWRARNEFRRRVRDLGGRA